MELPTNCIPTHRFEVPALVMYRVVRSVERTYPVTDTVSVEVVCEYRGATRGLSVKVSPKLDELYACPSLLHARMYCPFPDVDNDKNVPVRSDP
jgi:hypothetical protein